MSERVIVEVDIDYGSATLHWIEILALESVSESVPSTIHLRIKL